MFISKKELRELKKIKVALWTCENVDKLDLFKIYNQIEKTCKNIEKRKETIKCLFLGSFIIIFFVIMFLYALNGYTL